MYILLIIVLNLLITLLFFQKARSTHDENSTEDITGFLFEPYRVAQGENLRGWFYSHFSHASWGHLIFNMITLFFFAGPVIDQLGPVFFLVLYVISGLGADLLVLAFQKSNPDYRALGASGSVSGILFAAIVLEPAMNVFFIFVPVPIPGPVFAVLYLLLSFYLMKQSDGISHEAHIGGAVTGFVFAALLGPNGLSPLILRIQSFF